MKSIKDTSAYRLIRWIRHGFKQPTWVETQKRENRFYTSCGVVPDALCFDIGANVGTKTEVLRRLGGRVVSVEPVPECVELLKSRFGEENRVTIIPKALAAEPGTLPLHVGDSTTISSLRPDWLESNSRLIERQVVQTIDVDVTTLDELIASHGLPDFCKIDVEGFEAEVLRGLSSRIPVISFEFVPDNLDAVRECCSSLRRLGNYRYNLTYSSPLGFELSEFVDDETLLHELDARRTADDSLRWGDVIAKLGSESE